MTHAPARARLLDAAARRFYADGITATGIDAITAEAGVARMSLYNNFSSKGELVRTYVRARDREWLDLYERRAAEARDARARCLAVFDAYLDHAKSARPRGFRGCGLLNAAAELAADDPARAEVRAHKEMVEGILRGHLRELAPATTAAELAEHLSFLLEGSMARAGLESDPARLGSARAIAARLLDAL